MIPAADRWGPFRPDLDEAERRARLRCLRAVVHLSTGPRGADLADLLRRTENDPAAIPAALHALDRLAGLDRRHVLASYAALNRPAA
jgi:hypothetical protein